jgi:nitroreductase / dihydropteridine reductase
MSLITDLNWRYASKAMNNEVVTTEKLDAILEATNLTATSYGLQPYTILVVNNVDIKTKLQAAAYGQPQVGSASHILVFCVPEKITEADIVAFIQNVATTRHIPLEALEGYKQMMLGSVVSLTPEQQQIWSAKQAYIALGTALIAAAEQKVDTCPMEGFNTAQFDEILNLKEKGLISLVMLPIGYRSTEDATAGYAKVRKSKEEMFQFVN